MNSQIKSRERMTQLCYKAEIHMSMKTLLAALMHIRYVVYISPIAIIFLHSQTGGRWMTSSLSENMCVCLGNPHLVCSQDQCSKRLLTRYENPKIFLTTWHNHHRVAIGDVVLWHMSNLLVRPKGVIHLWRKVVCMSVLFVMLTSHKPWCLLLCFWYCWKALNE
jgi:hypothetical protein